MSYNSWMHHKDSSNLYTPKVSFLVHNPLGINDKLAFIYQKFHKIFTLSNKNNPLITCSLPKNSTLYDRIICLKIRNYWSNTHGLINTFIVPTFSSYIHIFLHSPIALPTIFYVMG